MDQHNLPILIRGGRIIDPGQGIDTTGSLLLADGKIIGRGQPDMMPMQPDCEVIDATGMVVCPGFIDLHCHLREPGYTEKETIATGSRAAAKGGFTTICCMPNTNPPLDTGETVNLVKSIAQEEGVIRVLPIGCITQGRRGQELTDMAELVEAGVAGFSDDGSPVRDDNIMAEALRNSLKYNLPVSDHCEKTTPADGWDMNGGEIARQLGLRGMPENSEESMIARDIELNRATGGKLHIAHVSTAASVSLIREAKKQGIRISAEVTPHHLTLTETAVLGYDTNAKVNPPLRTRKDIDALIEGLKDGTIDIIATDHAPHTRADKDGEFAAAAFGISNFETALGSLMSLVHSGKLDLITLITKLTAAPAKIIGDRFGQMGTLAIGAPADVIVFDPDAEWVVDTDKFVSKGKNTPLAGATLRGRVTVTIYQGRIAYLEDNIPCKN